MKLIQNRIELRKVSSGAVHFHFHNSASVFTHSCAAVSGFEVLVTSANFSSQVSHIAPGTSADSAADLCGDKRLFTGCETVGQRVKHVMQSWSSAADCQCSPSKNRLLLLAMFIPWSWFSSDDSSGGIRTAWRSKCSARTSCADTQSNSPQCPAWLDFGEKRPKQEHRGMELN